MVEMDIYLFYKVASVVLVLVGIIIGFFIGYFVGKSRRVNT